MSKLPTKKEAFKDIDKYLEIRDANGGYLIHTSLAKECPGLMEKLKAKCGESNGAKT